MHFPKPRRTKEYPLNLSLDTVYILEQFSKFANIQIDDVAEQMLSQLIEEPNFRDYILNKKRHNKKLSQILKDYKEIQ